MKLSITDSSGEPVQITTTTSLAVLFLVLFGAVVFGAYQLDKDLFKYLAQGLLNIAIGIAGFYFGSSQGSQKKDDTISKALDQPKDPA